MEGGADLSKQLKNKIIKLTNSQNWSLWGWRGGVNPLCMTEFNKNYIYTYFSYILFLRCPQKKDRDKWGCFIRDITIHPLAHKLSTEVIVPKKKNPKFFHLQFLPIDKKYVYHVINVIICSQTHFPHSYDMLTFFSLVLFNCWCFFQILSNVFVARNL